MVMRKSAEEVLAEWISEVIAMMGEDLTVEQVMSGMPQESRDKLLKGIRDASAQGYSVGQMREAFIYGIYLVSDELPKSGDVIH